MKLGKSEPAGRKSSPRRGEVYWVALISRPVYAVSPYEMNQALGTVVPASITSTVRNFPTRYTIRLQRKIASIALDQIRERKPFPMHQPDPIEATRFSMEQKGPTAKDFVPMVNSP